MDPYWTNGKITVYCGDNLDVLPLISDVALTVTSPPYNTLGQTGGGQAGTGAWVKRVHEMRYENVRDEGLYLEEQRKVAAAVLAASAPGACLFYNHKCRWRGKQLLHPIDIVRSFDGWQLHQEIIWDRGMATPFPGNRKFTSTDERIFWLIDPRDAGRYSNRVRNAGTVWAMKPSPTSEFHPAAFPAEIPWRAILTTTERGDLVLDPYAGSGTTLRVAQRLGRRAVGIEKSEEWCAQMVASLA